LPWEPVEPAMPLQKSSGASEPSQRDSESS
jgi:hypothetical protein